MKLSMKEKMDLKEMVEGIQVEASASVMEVAFKSKGHPGAVPTRTPRSSRPRPRLRPRARRRAEAEESAPEPEPEPVEVSAEDESQSAADPRRVFLPA